MPYRWNPLTSSLDFYTDEAESTNTVVHERLAGETISALKALYLSDAQTVALADSSDPDKANVFGVAMNASLAGGLIKALSFGELEDASFNFALNQPIFLGTNGTLTSVAPSSGAITRVGHGLGAGAIYIKIQPPTIIT